MNKIILMLLLSLSLYGFEWLSLDEGMKKVHEEDKLILIEVVRSNCHYCSDMQKEVFDNVEMGTWIESCFIPVKLNLDKEKLPKGISIQVTPTFVVLNADLKPVKRIQGSWNIQDFKDLSEKLCKEDM